KSDFAPRELLNMFSKRVVYIALNKVHLDYDQVMCDGREATEIAMQHLFDNGHKRIAYVGELTDEIRFVTYKEFLIRKNIEMPREYAIETTMTEKGGLIAAARLLEIQKRPSAIFCANDVTAIGVIKGLTLSGVKIPKDISVISIDNIKAIEKDAPILTTVEIPLKELGSIAVKVLCDRINGGHKVRIKVTLPVTLIKRASVKHSLT
ncbi:MAG: substrate-binding domain-containing protein, partial [Clostridia bacterium]